MIGHRRCPEKEIGKRRCVLLIISYLSAHRGRQSIELFPRHIQARHLLEFLLRSSGNRHAACGGWPIERPHAPGGRRRVDRRIEEVEGHEWWRKTVEVVGGLVRAVSQQLRGRHEGVKDAFEWSSGGSSSRSSRRRNAGGETRAALSLSVCLCLSHSSCPRQGRLLLDSYCISSFASAESHTAPGGIRAGPWLPSRMSPGTAAKTSPVPGSWMGPMFPLSPSSRLAVWRAAVPGRNRRPSLFPVDRFGPSLLGGVAGGQRMVEHHRTARLEGL